jgi:hypothetical protein
MTTNKKQKKQIQQTNNKQTNIQILTTTIIKTNIKKKLNKTHFIMWEQIFAINNMQLLHVNG